MNDMSIAFIDNDDVLHFRFPHEQRTLKEKTLGPHHCSIGS